jgi:hypothetical protein
VRSVTLLDKSSEDSVSSSVDMREITLSKKVLGERQHLVVDGEHWQDTVAWAHNNEISVIFPTTYMSRIRHLTLAELKKHFINVSVHLPNSDIGLEGWGFSEFVAPLEKAREGEIDVQFELQLDMEFWAQQYSIADLAGTLETVADNQPALSFEYFQRDHETCLNGFGVSFRVPETVTIEKIGSKRSDLDTLAALVKSQLETEGSRTVAALFEFPDSVKSACEQYLMYFGQFLKDLGIEAEAEIKEQAKKVLFNIKPLDETQALSQIREALDLYLQMPQASNFASVTGDFSDIAVSQLAANVLHLQSQVVLARALVEMKNSTISAQQTELAILKDYLDLREFRPTTLSRDPSKENEPIIPGVVSVKKHAWSFLEVDFPSILRKLKRIRK